MPKFDDSYSSIQQALAAVADPLKEYRGAMKAFSDPLSEYREALAAMPDPLKEYREAMKAFSDPLSGYREALAAMSAPLKEYREAMKAFSDPLSEYREALAAMSDPPKEYRETIKAFSNPLSEYREAMAALSDPLKEYREGLSSIKNVLDFLKSEAISVENQLEVNTDGSVSLNEKMVSLAELQELSNTIFGEAARAQNDSLEASLNKLISEVQKLNDPLLIKVVYYFVFPLIIGVIMSVLTPIADHYVNEYLDLDKRALAKEINRSVVESVNDRAILKEYRFVTADALNVRSSPAQTSESIGLLYFSSVVLIIERDRAWALIEWEDPESGAHIQGWVFSRYLKKFR